MKYEQQMRNAIEVAKQNPEAPFGAVLFDNESQQVAVSGINQSRSNPMLHGEIDAINNYARMGHGQWHRLTLFSTAEPCCMCQAAIIWAGIPKVVYGTSITTLLDFGWKQFDLSAQEIVDAASFTECEIVGGVLENECDQLFENIKT